VTDTLTIAGMRDRVIQLHHIASMTGNQEMRDLLFKVAGEIEAEIKRLETAERHRI
jgi:hypothetical protein